MFLQSKFYKHLRDNNFYFFVAFCFFFEAAASFLSRLQKKSNTASYICPTTAPVSVLAGLRFLFLYARKSALLNLECWRVRNRQECAVYENRSLTLCDRLFATKTSAGRGASAERGGNVG